MTALIPLTMPLGQPSDDATVDEAELAAAAFLARYQGRTLDAYRYDLRVSFQWASDEGLDDLAEGPSLDARGLDRTDLGQVHPTHAARRVHHVCVGCGRTPP